MRFETGTPSLLDDEFSKFFHGERPCPPISRSRGSGVDGSRLLGTTTGIRRPAGGAAGGAAGTGSSTTGAAQLSKLVEGEHRFDGGIFGSGVGADGGVFVQRGLLGRRRRRRRTARRARSTVARTRMPIARRKRTAGRTTVRTRRRSRPLRQLFEFFKGHGAGDSRCEGCHVDAPVGLGVCAGRPRG